MMQTTFSPAKATHAGGNPCVQRDDHWTQQKRPRVFVDLGLGGGVEMKTTLNPVGSKTTMCAVWIPVEQLMEQAGAQQALFLNPEVGEGSRVEMRNASRVSNTDTPQIR
ncbi:hypothetical protein EXE49_10665 [Halorubrum sp. ASP121]|uniref:hypothetical protein n=1 Tax=Halorubrum sp. ASP121 TaxID=1855858 RepID=UPI0010F6B776|nr:hypothetical protein [Halorubrum sp. ASP121]TKX49539.1 hypothetical protein EXE49_10665 [Halorubrum sp. ASP121]